MWRIENWNEKFVRRIEVESGAFATCGARGAFLWALKLKLVSCRWSRFILAAEKRRKKEALRCYCNDKSTNKFMLGHAWALKLWNFWFLFWRKKIVFGWKRWFMERTRVICFHFINNLVFFLQSSTTIIIKHILWEWDWSNRLSCRLLRLKYVLHIMNIHHLLLYLCDSNLSYKIIGVKSDMRVSRWRDFNWS